MLRRPERLPWTEDDDAVLREAVSIHGPKAWSAIACGLPRRSSKECRSRWLVLEGLDRATPESARATRGPPVLTAHLLAVATAEGASPRDAQEPAEAPAGSETPGRDYGRPLPARRLAQPGGRTPPPPLPPPPLEMMPSLAQRKAESARKRARLSPQAFLEEVLSPEHMQTSSVGLGTVEICDAMTMTGSEQLLAGDGGAGSADGAEEHERLGGSGPPGAGLSPAAGPAPQGATANNTLLKAQQRPPPLQCIADDYCAADEAFLHPRTPLLLRELDADDVSADPVRGILASSRVGLLVALLTSLSRCSQRFLRLGSPASCDPDGRVVANLGASAVGDASHGPGARLNVSPLATVLQGSGCTDSVQRLIHIAQNLSLQPPDSPLDAPVAQTRSPSPDPEPPDQPEAAAAAAPPPAPSPAAEPQPADGWKQRETAERGFIHRQLLHNLFRKGEPNGDWNA